MDRMPYLSRISARLPETSDTLIKLLDETEFLEDDHLKALDEYLRSSPNVTLTVTQIMQFLIGDALAKVYRVDPKTTAKALDLFTLDGRG